MSELAISVRGLSKAYNITKAVQHVTLAEQVLHNARNGFRKTPKQTFWALKDVSFDVACGDVVGIVGRNGAGKSTLLKVLSRITGPTAGTIDLYGRIGALLEVGTGFHAELTGRENIYLNGAILGMTKNEIRRRFDEIVDFSGVETFLDTPVKRYSSGMYVRLAFAVAANLNPEILIVDEVLAVGDAEFQKKCLGKMKDVANSGRTVLFVSHHMHSVSALCTKAIYMEKGGVKYMGEVSGAIDHYVRSFDKTATKVSEPARRPGSGEFRVTSITPSKEYYACSDEKVIRFTLKRMKPFAGKLFISCHVVDAHGGIILQCDSRMVGHWIDSVDDYEGEFVIKTPWLKAGTYRIDMFVCSSGIIDRFEEACHLEVMPLLPYPQADNPEATSGGLVFADFSYEAVSTEPASL
jgi:lipopolysaccharide transport system ATP-binding protein